MLAEKDMNVQTEMVCKQNSCTWETLVHSTSSDQEIYCDQQIQMSDGQAEAQWRTEEATTVCYQPTLIMWNVQIVVLSRVIHITVRSLHDCKHASDVF